MKKLLACILLLAPLTGWADTVTSRLSLTQPDINSANWGTKLNNNFGLVDAGVGVLGKTNNWTGTNNFTGPISISSYTNITSSVAFSTISVVNLTATNATISSATIANASITGFLVNVSTVVASSATFTNANVTGILTAGTANVGTANVSGNESLTGTLTVTSSSTLKGNVGINGNVNQPLTVTSSTTFTGNGEIDGTVKLGSAGNQVTISSNAVIGNTTFFPDAPMRTSSFTMTTGVFTYPDGSTQTVSARAGRILQSLEYTSVSASATTTTTFVPTLLTGAIVPSSVSSYIRVTAMGCLTDNNPAAGNTVASIFRGSTDLSVDGSHAMCNLGDGGVNVGINVPCTMVKKDSPATTSSTTYTVKIRMETGSGTATWGTNCGQYLLLEEISQ